MKSTIRLGLVFSIIFQLSVIQTKRFEHDDFGELSKGKATDGRGRNYYCDARWARGGEPVN